MSTCIPISLGTRNLHSLNCQLFSGLLPSSFAIGLPEASLRCDPFDGQTWKFTLLELSCSWVTYKEKHTPNPINMDVLSVLSLVPTLVPTLEKKSRTSTGRSLHVISLQQFRLFHFISFKFIASYYRSSADSCQGNVNCITWSPASGPSELNRIGRQRLSSFIKLEFWKWATSAALPWIRAYAREATFSLLNFSHFFPLNA